GGNPGDSPPWITPTMADDDEAPTMPKSTRRPRSATGNALADRQAQLDDLIRQQAADERNGDRVYGPQIDHSRLDPDQCAGPDPEPLDALIEVETLATFGFAFDTGDLPKLDFKARGTLRR